MNSKFILGCTLSILLLISLTAIAEDDKKPTTLYKFYGYLKLDAAFDDSRMNVGNFARWVESEAVRENDGEFNMTARESRFGFWVEKNLENNIIAKGRAEIDFYAGNSENKPEPMMRHAYLEVLWKDYDFSLIAGQTSDVISPLVPKTVNYPVVWWAGNIGYRRPQIRLTKGFDMGSGKLLLQGAVARTIGHNFPFSPGDTGEDASLPSLQGRVAYMFDMSGGTGGIGFSGHFGQEEFDLDDTGEIIEELDSWSLNIDINLPLTKQLNLKGEWFTGKNMDAYLGGIAQGVNMATLTEIETTGGWAALGFQAAKDLLFNAGYSMEDPEDDDLWAGARAKNSALWANIFYTIVAPVKMGAEISRWETEYLNADEADAMRYQLAFYYNF